VIDLADKRVLVFIVAYNAEKTIASVLSRIPEELRTPKVEVLIIDDFSKDETFFAGLKYSDQVPGLMINVLRNPENQGYGGNQKLGYRYAIDHGFDVVALVHGDGQYAPEKLPMLTVVFNNQMWGAVKRNTREVYPDGFAAKSNREPLTYFESGTRFEKAVEVADGYGEQVDSAAELPKALDRALNAMAKNNCQALLNIICRGP